MHPNLTLDDIHNAVRLRLAASTEAKLELADAVRECCQLLPTGQRLKVANHTLKWAKAECNLYGGRSYTHDNDYHQRVLLIDDLLVDEPSIEVELPDWADHDWPGIFRGPTAGWHLAGAGRRLAVCTVSSLHGIVDELPAAIAAWQIARTESLDAEITKSREGAASLHRHLNAS